MNKYKIISGLFFLVLLSGFANPGKTDKRRIDLYLVVYWNFNETEGQSRISARGLGKFALLEGNGPIRRVSDGIQDGYSALIENGKWFFIPRDSLHELNIWGG
ncbi:MAG TPA: hypothetical protein DCR40_13890 [Prolixibacteraceae bacterium]|nr:hypothetical protein [Prolixibacteraceae bacterium]